MTDHGSGAAARLRGSFDVAFAETPPPPGGGKTALLALRLDGRPYALRLGDVAGLIPGLDLLPLPGLAPGFLGLAAHRGGLWPVWDLGALLGQAPLKGPPRWLALAAGSPPWAAAFEHLEGYLEARPGDLRAPEGAAAAEETCALDGTLRRVPRLDALRKRLQKPPQQGEHGT